MSIWDWLFGKEEDYIGDLRGRPVRVQVKYDTDGNVIEGKMTSLPPEIREMAKEEEGG